MKFSTALTSLILIIPLFTGEALGAATIGRANAGKGGNKGAGAGAGAGKQGAGAGKGAAQNSSAAAAGANSTAAAAANSTAAAAANSTVLASSAAANNTGAANNGNPQDSTTLNPAVIATGFEQNGQENQTEAGQVPSLTSSNNFINFCLTVPNLPLTNGQQIKTGSCNPAPMGIIAATTNMPSAKFQNPVNGQNLQPNTAFNIDMAINNLETGNFVNADSNYYSAPQQVNSAGDIIGHTHFTVTAVSSFTDTTPKDPNTFAFFKGVNGAAVNGVVSEPVTAGLPAGTYRLCSINTDANHAPCLVAVAQHGTLDDCVYFSVGGAAGGNVFAAGAASNATSAASNATGAAAASNATSAASNSTGAAGASNATSTAAAGSGAAAAGKGAGAGAGKGAGASKGGNGANGGRKAGGRRVRVGNYLGRDY